MKDKQTIILILLIINTALLVLISYSVGCPAAKGFCAYQKKAAICPLEQKGSTYQQAELPKGSPAQ